MWPEKRVSAELRGHRRAVLHAAFASDGHAAATVDQEGTVLVHDLERGSCKLRLGAHYGAVHGSSFCGEDSNLLMTAGHDGALRLLDIREQLAPQAWRLPSCAANAVSLNTTMGMPAAHGGYVAYAVEFINRTAVFSAGADNKLKRWDLRATAQYNPKCVGEYLGHTAPVRCLAVSPDLRHVVSGCEDGSLRVWPKDPLSTVKSSLREIRSEMKQVQSDLEAAAGLATSQQKLAARLEALKQRSAPLKDMEAQMSREGYVPASRTLNGHVGLVSAAAWQEDANQKTAHILSSSWDQSVQLFSVGLADLA